MLAGWGVVVGICYWDYLLCHVFGVSFVPSRREDELDNDVHKTTMSMENERCEKLVRSELSEISDSQLRVKRPEKPPQIESRAIEYNVFSSAEDSG